MSCRCSHHLKPICSGSGEWLRRREFFRYASEDTYWVDAFKKSTAFKNIGVVRVLDFADEKPAGYGPLGEALNAQINKSAVVFAFLSTDYVHKIWTMVQWMSTLSEAQRRRLLFVPIAPWTRTQSLGGTNNGNKESLPRYRATTPTSISPTMAASGSIFGRRILAATRRSPPGPTNSARLKVGPATAGHSAEAEQLSTGAHLEYRHAVQPINGTQARVGWLRWVELGEAAGANPVQPKLWPISLSAAVGLDRGRQVALCPRTKASTLRSFLASLTRLRQR